MGQLFMRPATDWFHEHVSLSNSVNLDMFYNRLISLKPVKCKRKHLEDEMRVWKQRMCCRPMISFDHLRRDGSWHVSRSSPRIVKVRKPAHPIQKSSYSSTSTVCSNEIYLRSDPSIFCLDTLSMSTLSTVFIE